MTSLPDLRRAAHEIFVDALAQMDAGRAVRRAVKLQNSSLTILDTNFNLDARPLEIYVIALGKAACAMAATLDQILGENIIAGIISAPPCELKLSERWRFFAGGHPAPNASSLEAAQAAFRVLEIANHSSALVVFLVSGGGSAMLEWPRDERLTLDDLRETNRVLVSCGASISEINCVRRHLSAVKGGGLAKRAPLASQITLIISDTLAERAADVASGPSLIQRADANAFAQIITAYDFSTRLPPRVLRVLEQAGADDMLDGGEARRDEALRRHYVLLDNASALESAAEAAHVRGFAVGLAHDLVEQDVSTGARALVTRLFDLYRDERAQKRGVCLISGGEFSCPVRGAGVGGRNAETALRCAFAFDVEMRKQPFEVGSPRSVAALCAGTDGIDGNSPAAGAISDQTTIERARAQGLDAASFLDASDAYTLFDALGDTVITGATQTNVRDLRILLAA